MKLRTTAFVIAAAVSFAAPAGALPQDTATDPAMTGTTDTGGDREDDSGRWGLLGLLGLAGLLGMKRRDRDDDRRGTTGTGTGNR
jgi:hypothetical protein